MKNYTGSLADQGYRHVFRNGNGLWCHALEMLPGDIDLTNFTNAELEAFVRGMA